ncbi:MAG: hypothetical protein H6Q26_2153 [Bacteroidetes bacterium]|uniref:hypothetical protein n=1 Tax=unclassified Chitinophaga TaxID=2619133 RepID=UPI0009C62C64|nr:MULTISPECIES: hypothetical protein [unclassified Chitinophaga]MBP1651996.1 hypothetical protein [Bacteroidota bacterium]OMP77646.1 hypothetical protein BW716_18965 [[Flexibacter] sp. ATCC 35208]WPV68175.1 hypothetical protein QQL36_05520 [Chitinophaga sp. LS1]
MTLKFKLFRGLTAVNIMFSTFFLMGLVITLFTTGSLMILSAGIFLGAILIHAILSLHLQKALLDRNMVLKESTPGGIRIIGGISIFVGGYIALAGLSLFLLLKTGNLGPLEDVIKQLPTSEQGKMRAMLSPMSVFFILIGVIIVTNVLLSYNFLKQWKNRQDEEPLF